MYGSKVLIRTKGGLLLGAILAGVTWPGQVLANCGADPAKAVATVPISSLGITKPIYAFDKSGKFFKVDVPTDEWVVISDHRFLWKPSVVVSKDRRWISYSGNLKTEAHTQYWLYDTKTGRDRLYLQHPAWGGSIPRIAPDSTYLAVYANFDRRWPGESGVGLYLVDMETANAKFLGIPSRIPAKIGWASIDWSKDANSLLVMMRDMVRDGEPKREHYEYRIPEKRFDRISGEYVDADSSERFFRSGQPVPTAHDEHPQSQVGHRQLTSPDGQWIARIDGQYKLILAPRSGVERLVESGTYDNCAGVTIRMHGWLDDKHMIYSVNDVTRVIDASTGLQAQLFTGTQRPAAFLW